MAADNLAVVVLLINLSVGVISLLWARRQDGAPWLGASAAFHLTAACILAFGLFAIAQHADDARANMHVDIGTGVVLFVLSAMTGISALLLANLTERLTTHPMLKPSLPLVPTIIGLVVIETAIFVLGRRDFAYMVSEAAWLLACILICAKLLRLARDRYLSASARFIAVLVAIGFFDRALIALLLLISQAQQALLPQGSIIDLSAVGGFPGSLVNHLTLIKAVCVAWTGMGLLLLSAAWHTVAVTAE